MVKKKTPEQEESDKKKQTETSDNKVNSNTRNNNEPGKPETTPENGSGTPDGEIPAPEGPSSDKVVQQGNSLEEKLAEMQDKYIRLSAEFDNYRKRTLREKIELSKYAGENLLLNILPVMDDFERAISHMDVTTDCAAMKNGIDLIYQKFSEFLKQNNLKEIESLNCPFNVDLHDAVAKIKVEEKEKIGKIVEVIKKGYYLQDKVIRHAKVVIGE